jgi:hypothetical protein
MFTSDYPGDGEPPKSRANENIAYTTSMSALKLNISTIEGTFAIAARKSDVRTLSRRCLAGQASIEEQLSAPVASEEAWERNLAGILSAHESRHRSALDEIEAETAAEQEKLKQQIELADDRIRRARESIADSRPGMATADAIPAFDPDAIGDIDKLKQSIAQSQRTIAKLEERLGRDPQQRQLRGLQEVLDATSPPALHIHSQKPKF